MQPRYPIRTDFVLRFDSPGVDLSPGYEKYQIHIILDGGGNRKATPGEIEAVCSGNSESRLALYPQSAGFDCIDVDRGGLEGVKAVVAQLSSYTSHSALVVPSKTKGRYHVYLPVAGPRDASNTSPRWSLGDASGEVKGGTSRITLYHPVTVLNWVAEMDGKGDRIDPQVVRRELCPPRVSEVESSEGNYKKFLKRDLSQHDNILSAFLAIFEAGKRSELTPERTEELAQQIEDKSREAGREPKEIARARKNAQDFVDNQTGSETDAITVERRSVRAPDIEMAGYILAKFEGLMHYIDEAGKYVAWMNEKRRLTNDQGYSWNYVDVLSDISRILTLRYGNDEKERLYYGSAQRAKAVESLLQGQANCSVNKFDSNAYMLGCPRQDWDLRKGEGQPSTARNRIMKRLAILPIKTETPLWDKFITETFGESVAPFMQRYMGYCLTGTVREAKVLFLCGEGGSGKTTFANVARRIFGDYGTSIAKKILFPGRHSSDMHLTFIAQLQGKRIAIVPETDSYDKLNESLFKSLSGGDEITANFMRKDPFTFTNTAKLFVLSNSKPRLSSFDRGMRRRLLIVPCDNIPVEPDLDLEDKLMAEAEGILWKWLEECRVYLDKGLLPVPDEVAAVTKGHIDSQDLFGCFIQDMYEFDEKGKVLSSELLGNYKEYLHANNEEWMLHNFTMRDLASKMQAYTNMGVNGPVVVRSGGNPRQRVQGHTP